MIRRDYFIKLVQELSAVLLRIVSLKARREYAAALHEIDCALEKYLGLKPDEAAAENLEHVLALCGHEGGPISESLNLLAAVYVEQRDIFAAQQDQAGTRRAALLALGLYLEAVRSGTVSLDMLKKIDQLLESVTDAPLPSPVLRRLLLYLEDRGLYAKAEDVLYEWLERNDPEAVEQGNAFYARLLNRSDEELISGDLPRAEVIEGQSKLTRQSSRTTP
jgi:hypothetical protein